MNQRMINGRKEVRYRLEERGRLGQLGRVFLGGGSHLLEGGWASWGVGERLGINYFGQINSSGLEDNQISLFK